MDFRRIIALCMAFLVLWSSIGASVYKHICLSNDTYSASLYREENCGMEEIEAVKSNDCCKGRQAATTWKGTVLSEKCCETDHSFIKTVLNGLTSNVLVHTWHDIVNVWHCFPALLIACKFLSFPLSENLFSTLIPGIPLSEQGDTYALLQVFRC